MSSFTADRSYALQCDADDPLAGFRERFAIDDVVEQYEAFYDLALALPS